MRRDLICEQPARPPRLHVRASEMPSPKRGEVLVKVEASAVNPIDARRAGGYGQRLLTVKGAGTFPLVLGNDFCGTVQALGPEVNGFVRGQRVYGLVSTARPGGAHRSHVLVPQAQIRAAPEGFDAPSLAVLPYSFTTMWLAVRSTGLVPANASGKKVLVHGASGALGRLAVQMLSGWGCDVTGVCDIGQVDQCMALGARAAVERGPRAIASLQPHFDVVLNFASWDDEQALASRLSPTACGQATTVHPLLGNFDRLGWLRGAWANLRAVRAMRGVVRQRAPSARYAWTVFRPDAQALNDLDAGVREGRLFLPVGRTVPLQRAIDAFEHLESGRRGRAVLMPWHLEPGHEVSMSGIASLADVEALEKCAPSLPHSTYEMIRRAAMQHAQSPALSFFLRAQDHARPATWDYGTFFERITATANFFHALGVGKEDVIAFALPNLPETHLTIWGGQAAGIVFAINPLLEASAIEGLLHAAGATVLVTLGPFPGTDLWQKLAPVAYRVPSLRHLVRVDLARYLPGSSSSGHATRPAAPETDAGRITEHDFCDGIRLQPVDRLVSGRTIGPADPSSYFCTGGTTGTPKIAMRRHENEVANAWSAAQALGDGMGVGKTLFCGLPMFHVNAVLVTGLAPFSCGAHVLIGTPQGWRGEGVIAGFWDMVQRHRINFFSGVPTVYAALMQQPIEGRDVSSLEYGLCGAAPMPLELMRGFQERTGLKILEGYGLTEGTCVSTVNPPRGDRRLGSIGLRVPLQSMKAVVIDENGRYVRDCHTGEAGVLVIRGPNVFNGYKVAEHNEGLWIEAGDGQRWLNTGDLGHQDADGYFYLTGRKKELIIRGGHNIDPAVIEEPLHRHPAVMMAAAVGRPDAHAGEVPVAYVQLKSGAQATEDELLEFARNQIGERAAVPKSVRIVPAMPLTAVGKIYKPELKLREIRAALGAALSEANAPAYRLEVIQDTRFGIRVSAVVANAAAAEIARRVLGSFPFRFDVSWTS